MKQPSDTHEFEAIGTHWWLERLDGGAFDERVKSALSEYTAEFDQRYSRFRDDSLIAKLAYDGVLRRMPAEMLTMLNFAQKLYTDTEGIFSPLVGNSLQALGYGKLAAAAQVPASEEPGLTWTRSTVKVNKGVVLDFGGFGKGWLIDEYVKILRRHKVREFIVNGGGDLYVQASEPLTFALEHPYDPKQKIGDIRIQKGALAASSTVKRVWRKGKESYHHIIDPTTGRPATGNVVATFVCAHTALVADSLATVFIIRPELHEKLEKKYNVETAIITKDQLAG